LGALTYDMDGSLSPAMQQQRHDEAMAEAQQLEAEAQRIEEGA